jgi:hypothetical protein
LYPLILTFSTNALAVNVTDNSETTNTVQRNSFSYDCSYTLQNIVTDNQTRYRGNVCTYYGRKTVRIGSFYTVRAQFILCLYTKIKVNTVAYLLKATTVEPEKQPLLVNSSETTFIFRQRLGKRVPTVTDTHATIEVL